VHSLETKLSLKVLVGGQSRGGKGIVECPAFVCMTSKGLPVFSNKKGFAGALAGFSVRSCGRGGSAVS